MPPLRTFGKISDKSSGKCSKTVRLTDFHAPHDMRVVRADSKQDTEVNVSVRLY